MQRGLIELTPALGNARVVGRFDVMDDGTLHVDKEQPEVVEVDGERIEVRRVIYPLAQVRRILVLSREPAYGAGLRYDVAVERLFDGAGREVLEIGNGRD